VILTLLAATALAQSATPAPAAAPAPGNGLAQCIALARTDPERAIETAAAWRVDGGGIDARQCLGLAYTQLERWEAAGNTYEEAAREAAVAEDPRRADLLVQSGNAWLAGGLPARALTLFDEALRETALAAELRGEIHVDRARALVAMNNLPGARIDLDRAGELVPDDAFVWYLSSALAQREGNLVRAQADISRARTLAPEDPDIMLQAGTIAGLAGNPGEAERLYREVVRIAPTSDAAGQARESLGTLAPEAPAAPAPTAAQPQ